MKTKQLSLLVFSLLLGFLLFSCSNDPSIVIAPSPPTSEVEPILADSIDLSNCDTTEANYSLFIIPLIAEKCASCHSGKDALGGVRLDSYEGTKAVVDDGRFYGSLNWESEYEAMPQDKDKLSPCDLNNIALWIEKGALSN